MMRKHGSFVHLIAASCTCTWLWLFLGLTLTLQIDVQCEAFSTQSQLPDTSQRKGGFARTRLCRWSSTTNPSNEDNEDNDSYNDDIQVQQERRAFLSNLVLLTSGVGALSLFSPKDYANAIDIPFLSPTPLLRTKTMTPMSTLLNSNNSNYKQNNLLVSPGAGTDTSPIYYPKVFRGTWKFTSTFDQRYYPLGERLIPIRLRKRGSIRRMEDTPGDAISYLQTFQKENDGNNGSSSSSSSSSSDKTLPFREYNIQQQVNAQRGYEEVAEVKYDKNRQRLTIFLNTLGVDMQPLPPGRNEIFITNHAYEYSVSVSSSSMESDGTEKEIKLKEKDASSIISSEKPYHFSTMEFYRTITLGARSTAVLETSTFTTYDIDPAQPDIIQGKQRICLFLTPLPSGEEGDNYFEASNRAVGVYDYDILMERV